MSLNITKKSKQQCFSNDLLDLQVYVLSGKQKCKETSETKS